MGDWWISPVRHNVKQLDSTPKGKTPPNFTLDSIKNFIVRIALSWSTILVNSAKKYMNKWIQIQQENHVFSLFPYINLNNRQKGIWTVKPLLIIHSSLPSTLHINNPWKYWNQCLFFDRQPSRHNFKTQKVRSQSGVVKM